MKARRVCLQGFLYTLVVGYCLPSLGCSLGGLSSWHWSKETLISQTQNIIVAEVIQAEDKKHLGKTSLAGRRVLYRFRATEILKGKEPVTFVLFGALPYPNQGAVNSDEPRITYGSDCNPIVDFELHKKYIIFEPAFNGYAYQEYLGPNDKWYLKIKQQVSQDAEK